MDTFLIDVPVPSMGATVNELTVINLKVGPGERVSKGQKIAELESDKSVFEFESPCDGKVAAVFARAGDVKESGAPFIRMETTDTALKHLAVAAASASLPAEALAKAGTSAGAPSDPPNGSNGLRWTPKAIKLAQQAGLDPAAITDIKATGPGNRISGDDVTLYLTKSKSLP